MIKNKYRISRKHNYPFIFQPGEKYFTINQTDPNTKSESMEEYRLWDGQWYRDHSTLGLAELALSSAFHPWLLMVAPPPPSLPLFSSFFLSQHTRKAAKNNSNGSFRSEFIFGNWRLYSRAFELALLQFQRMN